MGEVVRFLFLFIFCFSVMADTPPLKHALTAIQLRDNPVDCSANQFATTIAANGDLTCSAVGDAALSISYLKADGSRALTSNWNAGSFDITASTFIGALTGNSSTATALASNPSDCSSDTYATTIAANGNLTCSTVSDAGLAVSYLKADGSRGLSANWNAGAHDITASTFIGSLTGNASTSTALASDPTDCASDRYATTIAASGNLTCAQVTNAGLAGSIASSKLVGTDIATVGTITTGTWNGSILGIAYGGTGVSLAATGGTSQVLKQATTGANITVGTLSCSDLSDDAASCATDATNASNISSGTLNTARLPAPIQLANGSAGTPSYGFSSGTDSGMYRIGTNDIGLAVAGILGLDIKKSTGSFVNIGMGVAASSSDQFPMLVQRAQNSAGVNLAVENTSTGANSKACIQLKSDNGANLGDICTYAASGTLDAITDAMFVRPNGSTAGLHLDGGDEGTGYVRVYTAGDRNSSGKTAQFNANHSTTFYGPPILQVQGAGSTPTCDSARNGGLALTSGYILCVCNGSAWKQTSDGSTTCTF